MKRSMLTCIAVVSLALASIQTTLAVEPASQEAGAAHQGENTVLADSHGCKAYVVAGTNTITWTGACDDGYISGAGTLTGSYGAANMTWTGSWVKGRMDESAQFVVTSSNGIHYNGTWKDGQPEGTGELTMSGARWTGEFHEGRLNGKGTLVDSNPSCSSANSRTVCRTESVWSRPRMANPRGSDLITAKANR